jgi:hypothetical protein
LNRAVTTESQNMTRFPTGRQPAAWWTLYEAAILEADDHLLAMRIKLALKAIEARSAELDGQDDDGREKTALAEARHALSVLHGVTLRNPGAQ